MNTPFATGPGTESYRQRFRQLAPDFFRQRFGLHISSIGLGTYLGANSPEASAGYVAAIRAAIRRGCNLIDTASNYRHMQSERDIRQALAESFAAGESTRQQVIVCTKGGFIPFDGQPPADPAGFVQALRDRLALDPLEVVGGHCLAPAFLQQQLRQSRENLGLETVDVYYLHNPETQLAHITRQEFRRRLGAAFAFLEQAATDGHIRFYGVATWDGLRRQPDRPGYLSLAELWQAAVEAGGEQHRFRFLQFPYNLGTTEAVTHANQTVQLASGPAAGEERRLPLLAAARQLGLAAVGSAGLMQAQLLGELPPELRAALGDWPTDAQAALHFNRSTPGLTATLVGMGQPGHVAENIQAGHRSVLPPEAFFQLFRGDDSTA